MLRQPIVTILAHVDHGKTTLLDSIRRTAVAQKEAGGITQSIGSSEIPLDTIKCLCSKIAEKFNFKFEIPGLLIIDTPGHEAFTTLRRRGGSIADIAILVIDINEGIMPQTVESIEILKKSKVPFVVALNKIDRIRGWISKDNCFSINYEQQTDEVKNLFEEMFYKIVAQLSEHGFSAERFDRISDFKRTVAIIPTSGKTGEGVPELLMILTGLSQQFLKHRLVRKNESAGMVLEVKEVVGLGTTIDTIIYDGVVKKNDYIIIAGKENIITKIKALLVPQPLRDIRTEKKFKNIDECRAAAGVKIVAPNLSGVVAGSLFRTIADKTEAEKILKEMEKEKEEVEISVETDGLILNADTLGSLEALINIFEDYPVKEAKIGSVTKEQVIKASSNSEFYKVIICFNSQVSDDIRAIAKEHGVKIIESDVIYRIMEEYEEWISSKKEEIKRKEIESITRPGKLRILPGCIFRASNPAIVGCEVLGGLIASGFELFKEQDGIKNIGEIKQVQSEGKNVEKAVAGEKVAISISNAVVGRSINEGDILYTDITSDEYVILKKHQNLLSKSEINIMEEISMIKRKYDKMYGLG